MKKFLILAITLCLAGAVFSQESSEAVIVNNTTNQDFEGYLKVSPNPGKGYFFMTFNLPVDAKKTVWTIKDEKGSVIVKEKYKKLKAGKNKIGYNYKSAPDGIHTFTITSGDYTISRKIEKKR